MEKLILFNILFASLFLSFIKGDDAHHITNVFMYLSSESIIQGMGGGGKVLKIIIHYERNVTRHM